MDQKKEAKLIVSFPVVVPNDYSIYSFRSRNPDKFCQIEDEFVDRHFKPSQVPKPGEKLFAHLYELNGRWERKECTAFITEKNGYFPNAVGLTLALEQGEKYLTERLKHPWGGGDQQDIRWDRSQQIIGLDTKDAFWCKDGRGYNIAPCLYSTKDFNLNRIWHFDTTPDDYFGDKEDCLLFFTTEQIKTA
ncbi:MAG: hypothetical protein WC719_04210 [Patescibacteria group bacterium]|jgi:hypothetical protein